MIDEKNANFYKKVKTKNVNLREHKQADQYTLRKEYCDGCNLFVSKLHLCSVIGMWLNIDTHHLHLILGRREEDVRRTNELEGDEYVVISCTSKLDLTNKLKVMGLREKRYKMLIETEETDFNFILSKKILHSEDPTLAILCGYLYLLAYYL